MPRFRRLEQNLKFTNQSILWWCWGIICPLLFSFSDVPINDPQMCINRPQLEGRVPILCFSLQYNWLSLGWAQLQLFFREVALSYFSEWWLMTEPLGLPVLTSHSVISITFVKEGNLNSPAPLFKALNCHLGHVKSKKNKCETWLSVICTFMLLKLLLSKVQFGELACGCEYRGFFFFQSLFFELSRRSPSMKPAWYFKKMKIQKNIW